MKGRGDQMVFILSTPTLTLPHRRGRGKVVENLPNKILKICMLVVQIFLKDFLAP